MKIVTNKKLLLLALFMVFWTTASYAAEGATVKEVVLDSLAGGLLGAAVVAFSERADSLDHQLSLSPVVQSGGRVATVGNGNAVANVVDGKLSFNVPTITPELCAARDRVRASVTVSADIIKGRF